jgi:hypothetical protein
MVNLPPLTTLLKRTSERVVFAVYHPMSITSAPYPACTFQFHTPPYSSVSISVGISIVLLPLIHKMIVDNLPTTKQAEAQLGPSEPNDTAALEELPPSFEQATEDRLLPEPPQQDPPPPFSTYTASFFTAGNGAIVSHDPHLNEDGVCSVTLD